MTAGDTAARCHQRHRVEVKGARSRDELTGDDWFAIHRSARFARFANHGRPSIAVHLWRLATASSLLPIGLSIITTLHVTFVTPCAETLGHTRLGARVSRSPDVTCSKLGILPRQTIVVEDYKRLHGSNILLRTFKLYWGWNWTPHCHLSSCIESLETTISISRFKFVIHLIFVTFAKFNKDEEWAI